MFSSTLFVDDDRAELEKLIVSSKESLFKAVGTGINTKLIEVPGLGDKKVFKDKTYSGVSIKYNEYMITVTLECDENLNVEIIEKTNL